MKNETRAALEHICRTGYSAYISTNPDVPNAAREKLHMPIHSGMRTPVTLDLDESRRGQKLYFCLRWIDPTGLERPWGEIHNAIVP
ncbi:MAG: hypothetical protein LBO79_06195 [Zoogloeaceae bacterium]|nr:hypothetical protein [Zoogloeaceae bacterium]